MPSQISKQSIPTQGEVKPELDQIVRATSKATGEKPSSMRRMLTIAAKTWHDCMKPKRVFPGLVVMLIVPVFVVMFTSGSVNYGIISIYSAAMNINFSLVTLLYWWTLGIVFTILVSGATSGVIADEVDKGTMLILVSKPVSRVQIFFGKFLGVYVFGALFSLIGIFLLGWIAVLVTSANISYFIAMIPFLLFMFVYSIFVELIFVSISMALSSILKTGRKTMMLMILFSIMTFVVFYMIRTLGTAYYTQFSLYWFDLGYHLGNILAAAIQTSSIIPSSSLWQGLFNLFTSAFLVQTGSIVTAQDIDTGGYPLTGYVSPVISLLIWISLAAILLVYGLIKLKRKEISN